MVFNLILNGTLETIYMVFFSTIFAVLIGAVPGVLAVITAPGNIWEHEKTYRSINFIINILRSFPYIILMILLLPLSRILVGTSIGSTAAVVPLAVSAAPFVARLIEGALSEVDRGIVEASSSMGASNWTIVTKVMIPEAMPSLIHGLTVTVISLIGFSAMAGAIGGGGLGDIAVRFGYQRFKMDVMIYAVGVIIVLVQIVQTVGNTISNKLKNKRGQ